MELNNEYIEYILTDPIEKEAVRYAMVANFKFFCRIVSFVNSGKELTFKPFHDIVLSKLQNVTYQKNEKRNLALCLPIGSGKSLILEYWIAWNYFRNINLAFVYVSHSDTMITSRSREIKGIIESDFMQKIYPLKLKHDERSRISWSFEGAADRTGLKAISIGGALTGMDAGNPNVNEFSGALVCFPYDELVWTDKGKIKIGYIVENKLKLRIYSFNYITSNIELQSIDNFIINKEDEVLRIIFNDLSYIECTPDHRIFTYNRGYVAAKCLLTSDIIPLCPFKCMKRDIKIFANIRSFFTTIFNYSYFFIRKFSFYSRFIIYNILGKFFPINTFFYRNYRSATNSKFSSNLTNFFSRFSNLNYLKSFQHVPGPSLIKWKSSMFNCIFYIVRFSSIAKIVKIIIGRIAVYVSYFDIFSLWSNKSPHQCLVYLYTSSLTPSVSRKSKISPSIFTNFYIFLFKFLSSIKRTFYNSFFSSNFTINSNTIKSFPSRNRKPLLVFKIGYINKSYCLTIRSNHNMYVGKSQSVLVKNCDDPLDAGNALSQAERENVINAYISKLETRRRTHLTPTILVMQRLHVDDLIGWAEKNEPEVWDIVTVSALDEENNISFWPERYPVEELKRKRELDIYSFSSLYQQKPILLGGNMIKTEWFKWYQFYNNLKFTNIFITSDTAQKVKECNDYSVFCVWGVNEQGLFMLDMVRGKWEAPDLERMAESIWQKWKSGINGTLCRSFYVEDKSSGTGLIQQLRRRSAIPVIGIPREKDKLTRLMDILSYIEAGRVFLPRDRHDITNPLLSECEEFSRDLSHKFDDICDTLIDAAVIGFGIKGKTSSFDPRIVGF